MTTKIVITPKLKETFIWEYSSCLCRNMNNEFTLKFHSENIDKECKKTTLHAIQETKKRMKYIENVFRENNLDVKKELELYEIEADKPIFEVEEEIIFTNEITLADTVKIMEYDGEYPALCSGLLTVEINGEIEKFEHCLESRGQYRRRNLEQYTNQGNWVFNPKFNSDINGSNTFNKPDFYYFKNQARKYMKESTRLEIERVINKYLTQGCCGGCD